MSGAKMHQTGAVNSHWLIFMPTMRMTEAERDWSVVGAVRVDAPGLTYIVGRQTNDTRDRGRRRARRRQARFAGQESMIVFEDVFVPYEHVPWTASGHTRRRWSSASRPITARPSLQNRVGRRADRRCCGGGRAQRRRGASHIKDKLVEMSISTKPSTRAAWPVIRSKPTASGAYLNDEMLSKSPSTSDALPFRDRAARPGHRRRLVVTMPSEKDLQNNEIGPLIRKFLQGATASKTVDACASCG